MYAASPGRSQTRSVGPGSRAPAASRARSAALSPQVPPPLVVQTRAPHRTRRQPVALTVPVLAQAVQLSKSVEGFSTSTQDRRLRLRRFWEVIRHQERPERTLAAFLWSAYAPSSAVTMGLSVAKAELQGLDLAEWANALRWLRKMAAPAQNSLAQAIPISVAQAKSLLRLARRSAAMRTLLAMFVTASRHADLKDAVVTHLWQLPERRCASPSTVMRISFPRMKSDLFGLRFVSKTIETSRPLASLIHRAIAAPATYQDSLRAAKSIAAGLTCHSMRRGAVTALAERSVPPAEIVLLTAHSMPLEAIAARRYASPSINTEEGNKQRNMTRLLSQLLLH